MAVSSSRTSRVPAARSGISYAAKTEPDGYTLLHAPSAITILPYAMKSVSYDLGRDFEPVVLVGLTQFVWSSRRRCR